ncbi:uncharacterized protein PAC_03439 [Phialocephala subalpina]|uniref:Heterokaryon incompatibility domain-containing protein n=1 Tax=Phialocephala subalpina TaxID=576137 RepID=A0A1L7WLC3_9HELO|nr:uncharacterized protein PAC_03439 [Phialocephala subalpina]
MPDLFRSGFRSPFRIWIEENIPSLFTPEYDFQHDLSDMSAVLQSDWVNLENVQREDDWDCPACQMLAEEYLIEKITDFSPLLGAFTEYCPSSHRAMIGTDWQPGHQVSYYSSNTSRYSVTAIDIIPDRSIAPIVRTGVAGNVHAYFEYDNTALFRRRLIPAEVNISLLRDWVSQCQQTHNHVKSQAKLNLGALGVSHFRVVDVLENRLVEIRGFHRYVALSYVWGDCAQPKVLTTNTNFIDAEHLPRTIRDAIHLTKLLGERYVWIDSICINQDSPMEKHALISSMDKIYESACLTIVAAGGEDANAGLPGLSTGTRAVERGVYVKSRGSLIQLVLSRPSLAKLISDSRWDSRGWTYQEHVLSECCLFFTETEVFYSCPYHGHVEMNSFSGEHLAEWREAYVLETKGMRTSYETQIEWGTSWKINPDPIVRLGPVTAQKNSDERLVHYTKAVPPYTRRELSHNSDIVLAFGGIMSKIWSGQDQPVMLQHGLPVESLLNALLWEAASPGQLTRRAIIGAKDPYMFPSWSWAGWIGPVNYPLTFDERLKDGWLYKPATQNSKDSPVSLRQFFSVEHTSPIKIVLRKSPSPKRSSGPAFPGVVSPVLQGPKTPYPPASPDVGSTTPGIYLLTESVNLGIGSDLDKSPYDDPARLNLRIVGGGTVSISLDGPITFNGKEHLYKLIVVGCGSRPNSRPEFEERAPISLRTIGRVPLGHRAKGGKKWDIGIEEVTDFIVMLVMRLGSHYERRGMAVVDANWWNRFALKQGQMEWILLR